MDIWALVPFRTLGFLCLLIGLSHLPTVLVGLGGGSAIVATVLSMVGICLLWIRPALFHPTGSYRVFRKTLSIVRSVIIFGGFAFIASGYFGGSEIGKRLYEAILNFRFSQWWITIIVATLVVLVIDLGLGVLQILIPRLDSK
jgi:ABC-type phosphate/phosphonate transport system permease subunit